MDVELEKAIEGAHAQFARIYLGGIPRLLNDDGAFLSFICVCSGVEALAGYRHPDVKENGTRFKEFLREYFAAPYGSMSEQLWAFRNSMVHAFSPGQHFALVHHQSQNHFRTHRDKSEAKLTVLNAEDFYAAFLVGAQTYFQGLRSSSELQELFRKRVQDAGGGLIAVGPLSLE